MSGAFTARLRPVSPSPETGRLNFRTDFSSLKIYVRFRDGLFPFVRLNPSMPIRYVPLYQQTEQVVSCQIRCPPFSCPMDRRPFLWNV